jgi:hypothetical protein
MKLHPMSQEKGIGNKASSDYVERSCSPSSGKHPYSKRMLSVLASVLAIMDVLFISVLMIRKKPTGPAEMYQHRHDSIALNACNTAFCQHAGMKHLPGIKHISC